MGPLFICSPNSKSKYSSHPPVAVQDWLTPFREPWDVFYPIVLWACMEKRWNGKDETCTAKSWVHGLLYWRLAGKDIESHQQAQSCIHNVIHFCNFKSGISSWIAVCSSDQPPFLIQSHFSSLFSPYFSLTPSSHQSSSLLTELPYQIAQNPAPMSLQRNCYLLDAEWSYAAFGWQPFP